MLLHGLPINYAITHPRLIKQLSLYKRHQGIGCRAFVWRAQCSVWVGAANRCDPITSPLWSHCDPVVIPLCPRSEADPGMCLEPAGWAQGTWHHLSEKMPIFSEAPWRGRGSSSLQGDTVPSGLDLHPNS